MSSWRRRRRRRLRRRVAAEAAEAAEVAFLFAVSVMADTNASNRDRISAAKAILAMAGHLVGSEERP